jgi:hypothetical protein
LEEGETNQTFEEERWNETKKEKSEEKWKRRVRKW